MSVLELFDQNCNLASEVERNARSATRSSSACSCATHNMFSITIVAETVPIPWGLLYLGAQMQTPFVARQLEYWEQTRSHRKLVRVTSRTTKDDGDTQVLPAVS
jgi:hypothetical protein